MTVIQQIKKLRKFDIISVHWEDIAAICSWMSAKSIDEFETVKCHTVGFFMGRTGSNIKVSYSYRFEDNYGAVEVIPIGVILEIRKHGRV